MVRVRFNKFWLYFFLIKIAFLFFAIFVYGRLTQLGDTERYLSAPLFFNWSVLYSSTSLMDFVGGISRAVFRTSLLANLPFTILTFFSIKYAVDRLRLKKNLLLLVLISMPSFAIWTSVCSKEAVGVFYGAILVVYIIEMSYRVRRPTLLELVALYLAAVFKPFNFVFIFQVLLFVMFVRAFKINRTGIIFLAFLTVSINIAAFYVGRDYLDLLSRNMAIYFESGVAKSNRPNTFWVNKYDVFWNAPYTMYLGFIGPTIKEMLDKPLQLLAGLESYAIVLLMSYLLLTPLYKFLRSGKFNLVYLFSGILLFTGLLFVQSLYGALNPGSAVRYRENIYIIFILLLLYNFYRNKSRSILI